MSRPTTRADEVRMMSSQASKQPPRQASITALDLEDGNVRPNAWFAYVMPVQMGVEMIGAGRYGFWDNRPTVTYDSDYVTVEGHEDEPILVVPRATTISVYVAQAKHAEATPFPVLEVQSSGS
jgi:hypothetical protein